MIERVRGELVLAEPTRLVLMTGGVGLSIAISVNAYERLAPRLGAELELPTHLYVREDQLSLFGFADREERSAFLALLTISGVGPRVAMALLSSLPVSAMREAVATGQWKRLTAAPGVGRKLAERLTVELRDKLGKDASAEPTAGAAPGAGGVSARVGDAVAALVALGHNPAQAEKLASKAVVELGEEAGVEEVIRRALKG